MEKGSRRRIGLSQDPLRQFVDGTRRQIQRAARKKSSASKSPQSSAPASNAAFDRHRQAILPDPENSSALRSYADWLTAQGNPQGEFIHADLDLAAIPAGGPQHDAATERWTKLYEQLGEQLVEPLARLKLAPDLPIFYLKHGLLATLTVTKGGILPKRFDEIVAAAPFLSHLILEFSKVPLAEIVRHPSFAQIRSLEAWGDELRINAVGTRALAQSPHTINLRELDLNFGELIGDAGTIALASTSNLMRLRKLSLRAVEMTAVGLKGLLAPNHWHGLRELDLGLNHLGGDAAPLLAAASSLAQLETLKLGSDRLKLGPSVSRLASAAFAWGLKSLDLTGLTYVEETTVRGLAKGKFDRLEDLNLSIAGLNLPGLEALAQSRWFPRLRKLDLGSNELPTEAMEIIAGVRFRNLQELRIGYNPIGSAGLKKLLENGATSGLQVLELYECELDANGADALAAAKLPELKELELLDNPLGTQGAAALTRLNAPKLSRLSVTSAQVKPAGLKSLRKRFGEKLVAD